MTIDKKDVNDLYHLEYRRRKLEDDLRKVESTIKWGNIVLALENRAGDNLTSITTGVDDDIVIAVVKSLQKELTDINCKIEGISAHYRTTMPMYAVLKDPPPIISLDSN